LRLVWTRAFIALWLGPIRGETTLSIFKHPRHAESCAPKTYTTACAFWERPDPGLRCRKLCPCGRPLHLSNPVRTPCFSDLAALVLPKTSGNKVTVIQEAGRSSSSVFAVRRPTDLSASTSSPRAISSQERQVVPAPRRRSFAPVSVFRCGRHASRTASTVEAYKATLRRKSIAILTAAAAPMRQKEKEKRGSRSSASPIRCKSMTVYSDSARWSEFLAKATSRSASTDQHHWRSPFTEYVGAMPGFLKFPPLTAPDGGLE